MQNISAESFGSFYSIYHLFTLIKLKEKKQNISVFNFPLVLDATTQKYS